MMKKVFKNILILTVLTLILHGSYGYIIYLFWKWYVVPIGLPDISIAHAIGLKLFVSLFTDDKRDIKHELKDDSPDYILTPIIISLCGYSINHFFMMS